MFSMDIFLKVFLISSWPYSQVWDGGCGELTILLSSIILGIRDVTCFGQCNVSSYDISRMSMSLELFVWCCSMPPLVSICPCQEDNINCMVATPATLLCALEVDGTQDLVQPRAQMNSKELQLNNILAYREPGMNTWLQVTESLGSSVPAAKADQPSLIKLSNSSDARLHVSLWYAPTPNPMLWSRRPLISTCVTG